MDQGAMGMYRMETDAREALANKFIIIVLGEGNKG
jgi:hypothetical protein